ncbi:hypothetical protein HWC66_gp85 [Gordonia phage Chikenjars]|uniref:Uncharacterized protein n=1 Tax=Gordonia phage Chikenjars TaxID=2601686 RepID=A0A5J6D956_9CAUD|nr:hypothetical protein HWC66_gp85 [Gordonia phage Chikenjars]QEQ94388.1 hypothetical protein SEA_CHIKENJARS_85 [Gordonia phage Chikenjars]
MSTIEVCIHNRDHVKFLDWAVVPEHGLELLLQKVMGASKEQREHFVKRLNESQVYTFISEDGEYTLVADLFGKKN